VSRQANRAQRDAAGVQIPDTLPNSLQKFYCNDNQITQIPFSIIQLQKLTSFRCDSNVELPLVAYFLNNYNDTKIKQYCYNLMWKVRMEF